MKKQPKMGRAGRWNSEIAALRKENVALRKLAEGVRQLRDGEPGVYTSYLFDLYNALPPAVAGLKDDGT